MKRLLLILFTSCPLFFAVSPLFSLGENAATIEQKSGAASYEKEQKSANPKNVNLDMEIVYGQYHNMLSTINLSQEQQDFVYLLSSYFKRSNDFGFNGKTFDNTSYYVNKIGFTGNYDISPLWKTILETQVDNDSRGMFDNPRYTREEKDKIRINSKNLFKFANTPFESYFTIGWANYIHRLQPSDANDVNSGRSTLNKMNIEIGGEYIWSASNRIRYTLSYSEYHYDVKTYRADLHGEFELLDDINLTRNLGITFGLNADWDRDARPLASPIVSVAIKGFSVASLLVLYRYDLVAFRPEEFYLEQKYIKPTYDLPPARVHHGEVKTEIKVNSFLLIKGGFTAERNNNFYNYETVNPGNVLSARTIAIKSYTSRGDTIIKIFNGLFSLNINYEYIRYNAPKQITYRPNQIVSNSILFNGANCKIEWNNRYMDDVYIDPDDKTKLKGALVGSLGVQQKVMESFYAYLSVENLYNNRYNLRNGYPEPGIVFLGGLRLLM